MSETKAQYFREQANELFAKADAQRLIMPRERFELRFREVVDLYALAVSHSTNDNEKASCLETTVTCHLKIAFKKATLVEVILPVVVAERTP